MALSTPSTLATVVTMTDPSPTIDTAMAATTTLVSMVSAALATAGATEDQGPDETGECQLLGPFSLLIQAALGGLAILSLVYKRWRERPQRPLKVWAFDVSKQVFGSVMLHLANLLLSMFSAGHFEITQEYQPNPCSFYLLNLGIDTTLGIPILYLILRIINRLAQYTPLATPPESIESGNYGDPPKAMWWFKQAILYFIGLLWMKISVFVIIQVFPIIVRVGDWALRWTEGNTALQIIFVMLLFPLTMNAIQYYIVDTFIKRKITVDDDSPLDEESAADAMLDDDRHHRSAFLASISDEEDDSDSGDEAIGKPAHIPLQGKTIGVRSSHEEYDPEDDGEGYFPESSSSKRGLGGTRYE